MRFATLCMHFPRSQRRKPTTQSHLDTTVTMRFATLCMHFPLAQRRKPTTQSHPDTTVAMRFATLCVHFPLAQRRKPTTLTPPLQCDSQPMISLPKGAPTRTYSHIGDHSRTCHLTPPTFAPTRSRFYCKTQYFAHNLTFRHNFCVEKHSISCAHADFTPPLQCDSQPRISLPNGAPIRTYSHIGDHSRTRRLTPPTFAPTHSRFYCKTQHFAHNLTFRHNFCLENHNISCAHASTWLH